jgi:FtsH-binding integral membrane protein
MRAFSATVVGRWQCISLVWLAVACSFAQLADLLSSLAVTRELNPIASAMAAQPVLGFALKVALIALVVATAVICDRRRPGVARLVLVVGILAGLFGALSNTHLTPFVGA